MRNRENRLGGTTENLTAVIFALAWPTMLEQLMDTAVQYVDTAMVGSLGTSATAAVGCTATVNWLIGSTISAFGVGFLSYIAKAYGAGDRKRASQASAQAVSVVLLAGLLFTALTMLLSNRIPVWMQADPSIQADAAVYFRIVYSAVLFRAARIIFGTVLRASGDTKTPMQVGVGVNVANVIMNWLLIYPARSITAFGAVLPVWGAGMGIRGAAAATAASIALGGFFLAIKLWKHPEISPKGQRFLPDRVIMVPCLKVAFPNMLQRFCTSLGYVVFASMINRLGEIGTAAHTVANTVESAFYVPGFGMMAAAATLSGNCIGAGDRKRLTEMARRVVLLEVSMMAVTGGLLFAFAPTMVSIFSKDDAVILLGSSVLRMVALSEPFFGISIVTEGMLQGAGKTVRPFFFNVLCMWGVRILGTYVCVVRCGLGLRSAWACMIANNVLLMVLFRIYFRSLLRKRTLFPSDLANQ